MTPREQLLQALLVERFTVLPREPVEDTDIDRARRRRVLAEATSTEEKTA
jgi:hypothetical protein